ncbi:hypothetical protein PHLGIDRAFT_61049, partial [Phlebiopsis gigantea 11061_1 CR5-6]
TLARINDYANDVEMLPANVGATLYLILDTNVLIDNLKVIRAFSEDVEKANLPWPLKIIVPSVTLSELDGLKNSHKNSWFARTASTMLLEKVKEKKSIKVQARSETLGTKPKNHEEMRTADIAIWDCSQYFKSKPGAEVVLLSNDKNLCIVHENDEPVIPTVSPGKRAWSSYDLAKQLFGAHADLSRFRRSDNTPRYRPARSESSRHLAQTEGPRADDDGGDGMDIDDDDAGAGPVIESWVPSHALDGLHLQVIDHFSSVLKQLADRVRHEAGDAGPPARSQYAPEYRRKAFAAWTVRDCMTYLGTKKTIKEGQPPLQTFLLRRNEDRGWRRGQDWPHQAWLNCLDVLTDIAIAFEDNLLFSSLHDLSWQVDDVFNMPMRPTGI